MNMVLSFFCMHFHAKQSRDASHGASSDFDKEKDRRRHDVKLFELFHVFLDKKTQWTLAGRTRHAHCQQTVTTDILLMNDRHERNVMHPLSHFHR